MLDKQMLIQLVNGNVSIQTSKQNSKKAEKSILSAFFFVSRLQCSCNVYSM